MTADETHEKRVREQFTNQAIPFTKLKGHLDSVALLIDTTGANADDSVLDVACGPGLVACEFAKISKTVSGIDLTEKMIIEAQKRQIASGLNNMDWQIGPANDLPYEDESFSVVISRYTFHHFTTPQTVLREMIRVCKPGGRVLVADPVLPSNCVHSFNSMERLRDPSHTQAFSVEAFDKMFHQTELKEVQRSDYKVDMELEQQLAASFPEEGNEQKLRDLFQRDVSEQRLGVNSRIENGQLHYTYPISVYVGKK